MLLLRVQFMFLTAIIQTCDAIHRSPPVSGSLLLLRGRSNANSVLAKRAEDCGDGTYCQSGSCCGKGCGANCCAHDDGGIFCGNDQRCEFAFNVFIGCCPISAVCTGTAESIPVTSPFSTVVLATAVTSTTTPYSSTYEDSTTSDISFPTYSATYEASTASDFSFPTYTRPSDLQTPTSSQEYIPTATSIADDEGESGGRGKLSTGAKAGIGVGVSVGGLALAAVAAFFFKRKKNKKAGSIREIAYTPAPPAPMPEDNEHKGQEMSKKEPYAPAYPSHASELSAGPETGRYEMPG